MFFDDNELTPEEPKRLDPELSSIFSESTVLHDILTKASEDLRAGHLTLEDLEELYAYVVQRNNELLEQLKVLPYSDIPLPAREETGQPRPYNTLTDEEQCRVSIEFQVIFIESTISLAESEKTSAEYAAGRITSDEMSKRFVEQRLDWVLRQARQDALPRKAEPYKDLTPKEQGTLHTARMALGDLKGVLAIKGKKAFEDWKAGRITSKEFQEMELNSHTHEASLDKHQGLLSWALDIYRERYKQAYPHTSLTPGETHSVHTETKAIATQSTALFSEARKALADQQARRVTFEESGRVFANIDKRLKALEERLKVLRMPPLSKQNDWDTERKSHE